jgi:hypothetical protein
MFGVIGTSSQLQSIITAHTLNSFWSTYMWRISSESLTNLSLISTTLKFKNGLPFINATRPRSGQHIEEFLFFCVVTGMTSFSDLLRDNDLFAVIRCNGNYSLLIFIVAETWLPSRCLVMDICSCSTIPVFSRHVTAFFISFFILSLFFPLTRKHFFLYSSLTSVHTFTPFLLYSKVWWVYVATSGAGNTTTTPTTCQAQT